MRKNLEYLYNVARDMMGRTKAMQLVADGLPVDGAVFRRSFAGSVQQVVRSWNAETLGSIVALAEGGGQTIKTGRATLRDVGLGESTTEHMDGRMLLIVLTSLTIVAAMLDLARNHQERRSADGVEAYEKTPDRLLHF